MTRPLPLWQILVRSLQNAPDRDLTCDECFAVLEYLADSAVAGADPDRLRRSARRHLAHCPDCREHHLRRLRELEAQVEGGRD